MGDHRLDGRNEVLLPKQSVHPLAISITEGSYIKQPIRKSSDMSQLSYPLMPRENGPIKNQACKMGLLAAFFTQLESLETPCMYADLSQKSKREKEG